MGSYYTYIHMCTVVLANQKYLIVRYRVDVKRDYIMGCHEIQNLTLGTKTHWRLPIVLQKISV